ncbi:hypothetical protein DPEC_G00106310 [Dallia pectoralis]|uniref:Uncharacterized protein n=1 Tax=Dallia pectoralis TaxID=75939 RepID=A0ACC2GXZ3_DALPE|nr:hypothetical protein DPEC_G00106310 [Dallia pectoralis]
MKTTALKLLLLGVLYFSHVELHSDLLPQPVEKDPQDPSTIIDPTPTNPVPPIPTPAPTNPATVPPTTITVPPITTAPPRLTDAFLGPAECLDHNYTRLSCGRVFCPPWMRCMEGRCVCKLPYLCPKENMTSVCGHDGRTYLSYCMAMAVSCRSKKPIMSHFEDETCSKGSEKVQFNIDDQTGLVSLTMPGKRKLLVCGGTEWNIAAANVMCLKNNNLGASTASSVRYTDVEDMGADHCISVRCQGYENSLAECSFSDRTPCGRSDMVATVTCYQEPKVGSKCEFRCVNGKCVSLNETCDGVDHCGDRSDEMCCTACRGASFRCKSGVCVSKEALRDGVRDCLGGEDEMETHNVQPARRNPEFIQPQKEVKESRKLLEERIKCGIPNPMAAETEQKRKGKREKRVVGGEVAKPTQIQWQVAIQERGRIDCGGAYIGGCWVLTAAHCVRPKPDAYHIKFSLWKKGNVQGTTDIVPVKNVIIHHKFNANTYENDIALIEMKKLPFKEECFLPNPAVSAVCVPWSIQQFNPNHTCSISGWGRMRDGSPATVLLWANVSLIDNCKKYYKERFMDGMMCAGDLEGLVDSCQGDSGGPLVCQDSLGISYLWGIVSWGEKCGQANYPGVYTQVAHYFEWIRGHTSWPAITKYNL